MPQDRRKGLSRPRPPGSQGDRLVGVRGLGALIDVIALDQERRLTARARFDLDGDRCIYMSPDKP
jgi:hypothetical protein